MPAKTHEFKSVAEKARTVSSQGVPSRRFLALERSAGAARESERRRRHGDQAANDGGSIRKKGRTWYVGSVLVNKTQNGTKLGTRKLQILNVRTGPPTP